eukprot:scaffold48077_cov33-Tisochrysis_lutea.AAC.3
MSLLHHAGMRDARSARAVRAIRPAARTYVWDPGANRVLSQLEGTLVHGIRQRFECRPAIAYIILDAKVVLRSSGVVRCREQDSTARDTALALPNDTRGGGRREEPVAPNPHARHTARGRHLADDVDGGAVVVPAVSRDDESGAAQFLGRKRVEQALDEVLEVAWLHEDGGLLAEARSPGLLAFKGRGGHCAELARDYGLNEARGVGRVAPAHDRRPVQHAPARHRREQRREHRTSAKERHASYQSPPRHPPALPLFRRVAEKSEIAKPPPPAAHSRDKAHRTVHFSSSTPTASHRRREIGKKHVIKIINYDYGPS